MASSTAGIDALVVHAVSKCWTKVIDPETLLAILLGKREMAHWQPHIHAFFSELPVEAVLRFLYAHAVRPSQIAPAYRRHLAEGGDRNPRLEEWFCE